MLRKYYQGNKYAFPQSELFEMLCDNQNDLQKLEAFAKNIDKATVSDWEEFAPKINKFKELLREKEVEISELREESEDFEQKADHLYEELNDVKSLHENCLTLEDNLNDLQKIEFLRTVVNNFSLEELETRLKK